MQETLGQESSQRSTRPRRGDLPPSYAEGSEEEEIEEETLNDVKCGNDLNELSIS
jgi:hypothetical protein